MSRRTGVWIAALGALTLAVSGCGDDAAKNPSPSPTTASSTPSVTTIETPRTEPEIAPADEPDLDRRLDRKRARRLMSIYRDEAAVEPWAIKKVEVDGGDVTVKTGLYPDHESRPQFVGACTALIAEDWIETLTIEGQDDLGHASWFQGDTACETQGLG